MKNVKKIKKTKLYVEREILRVLKVHQLRAVDGGGGTGLDYVETGASGADVCCA